MTVDELSVLMDSITTLLETNQAIITPELLVEAQNIIQQFEVKFGSTMPNLQRVLKVLTLLIDTENKLVTAEIAPKIINTFSKIKQHPVIMKLIADMI